MKYEAFIFDMDSLLADTSQVWESAAQELLSDFGYVWTQEISEQYRGMDAKGVAKTLRMIFNDSKTVDQWFTSYRKKLITAFDTNPVYPMGGVYELLERINGKVPVALASGSPLCGIRKVVRHLEIQDYFKLLLSSEEVGRDKGKPKPDVFLAAAEKLNVRPEKCLVFEDSYAGALAAQAANMDCYVVPSANEEVIAKLDNVKLFESLADIYEEHIFGD